MLYIDLLKTDIHKYLLRLPVLLGRSFIHELPGGCGPFETTQQAKLPKLSLTIYVQKREKNGFSEEGGHERKKQTRESVKRLCVGLVQFGDLDPEAVLSFPGNENKQTYNPPFQTRNIISDFLILTQKNTDGESQCNYS